MDVAATPDFEDGDGEVLIPDLVQDAMVPLSNPEQIPARDLLAARP
jgi:hypothetical protein